MWRRLISLPLFFGLFTLLWSGFPLWLCLSLILDLLRPRQWALSRTLLFMGGYLAFEVVGVLVAGALFLRPMMSKEEFLAANYRLQWWWNYRLFRWGQLCYGMKTVEQWDSPEVDIAQKPVLLFIRHTSTIDTVLPVSVFSWRHGLRLRFVLKEELRWDPCLDIVGGRLPNAFVSRGRGMGAQNLARVQALTDALGPGDGVLIYPEGTRFTKQKRQKLLEKLSGVALEQARALQHVLPVHPGGPVALLENIGPEVDIWFCGHVGYEASGSFKALINGGLVNKTIYLRFYKRSAADLPTDHAGRQAWLAQEWQEMDRWVGSIKDITPS